jgi:tetratricopeptide (TPR) repeat protein
MREPEAAQREFEAAIEADPNYYMALGMLGVLHMQLGRTAQAEEVLERSLKVHSEDKLAHFNLGVIRYQQRNIPQAVRHFREAVRIDPDYAPARENLKKLEPLLNE